jgi:hypothetical protein
LYNLPDCVDCQRLIIDLDDAEKMKCKAFLDGIPNDILIGKIDHYKPYSGDKGLTFLKR